MNDRLIMNNNLIDDETIMEDPLSYETRSCDCGCGRMANYMISVTEDSYLGSEECEMCCKCLELPDTYIVYVYDENCTQRSREKDIWKGWSLYDWWCESRLFVSLVVECKHCKEEVLVTHLEADATRITPCITFFAQYTRYFKLNCRD